MTDETTCTSCGGTLATRRRFRLGPAFATLGFGGLALAGLVVFASLIMVFSGIDRLEAMLLEQMREPRLEVLRVAGVPGDVVRKLAEGEAITDADRAGLDDRQRRLVGDARQQIDARRAAITSAAERTRIRFIAIAAGSTALGLLCLPLLLRTETRECPRCLEAGG
jgi:hypothetical protein